MKLDFVLVGEDTAPHGALQVFGEVEHHAISSVTTGNHSLMSAVHVIVMPYDDGELFSLHFDLQLQVTDVGLAPHWVLDFAVVQQCAIDHREFTPSIA